jgi:hypothetical protein
MLPDPIPAAPQNLNEAVYLLLGHSRADVAQVYVERNQQLAATVAAKIG